MNSDVPFGKRLRRNTLNLVSTSGLDVTLSFTFMRCSFNVNILDSSSRTNTDNTLASKLFGWHEDSLNVPTTLHIDDLASEQSTIGPSGILTSLWHKAGE